MQRESLLQAGERSEYVADGMQIVEEHERLEVSAHPFFCSLRSAPVNLEAIWVLMANLRAGISRDFTVWLALTIARVEDRRIASLLAKQLNDELGNGQFDAIHARLLDGFVSGLERWRPREISEDVLLRPGRQLAESGARQFRAEDVYEGVGALMVGEIFAKKMDLCVGDEIRRQHELSSDTLAWLTLHETLEVNHADDSRALAELVPLRTSTQQALRRGALAQWQALWGFLDDVHRVAVAGSD